MNLLTLLFAAKIGISPVNTDMLRDIDALFFTDLMCSASICNRLTITGGVTTDSRHSHSAYFKPIQDKYYLGGSIVLHRLLSAHIQHDCRHTVSSFDKTYDRYDISKSLGYISVDINHKIVSFSSFIGGCMMSQRYSLPRADIINDKIECYTYGFDDRKKTFYFGISIGIKYRRYHFQIKNCMAAPAYNSIKTTLEYELKHCAVGCMYEYTAEYRSYHNYAETNKLQFYFKVFK